MLLRYIHTLTALLHARPMLQRYYRLHCSQHTLTHTYPHCARKHRMSTVNILLPPASYSYMETADVEQVRHEWFITACYEWITWQRAAGVTDEFLVPEQYAQEGDLQTLATVVSWWPKNAPARYRAPSLAAFIQDLRVRGDAGCSSMAMRIDYYVNRVREHIQREGGDPQNPNETKEERAKRKNRERQKRFQLAHAESNSDDPVLDGLVATMRAEAQSLTQGKAWLKRELAQAKAAEQAAIAHARAARAERVSAAEAAVAAQEQRMLDAKAVVDAYKDRINK